MLAEQSSYEHSMWPDVLHGCCGHWRGLRLGLQWEWAAGPGQQWQPANPMQSGRPARHPCAAGTSPRVCVQRTRSQLPYAHASSAALIFLLK